MKKNRTLFLPLVLVFLLLNSLIFTTKRWQEEWGFSQEVLLVGNLILFVVSVATLFFHTRGALHQNPNAFLRSVYSSLLVKMFGIVVAVLVYAVAADNNLNKPSLFFCMALYFVYTFVEVRLVMRLLKQKNHE